MVKESAATIHFDDQSVSLSVRPSICPSSPPYVHQSVCCSLSVFGWSVDLPINLSVNQPV